MNPATLVTGGAGFLGSHLCDRLIAQGLDVLCVDNFYTGSKDNIRHLVGHSRFELIRHDVLAAAVCGGGSHLQPSLPGQPDPLPERPDCHHKDLGARCHQHAGAGQATQGAHLASLDQRGVRRPATASAAGKLLGPRQHDWPTRLL